ncbi:MAG TPA: FkbM family methyltransferase [Candidatus Dojkabacteria bacterium]|nr:FkbM family methyltransferase [Candidatus Dojkabacteria bacterium]
MGIKGNIKKLVNKLGYDIKRKTSDLPTPTPEIKPQTPVVTPEWQVFTLASTSRALFRAVSRGLEISNVIDIGASNGSWSAECMKYFPLANYYLIEANSFHKEGLEKFCLENKNSKYILAAAGSKSGECFFDNSDPFGGVAGSKQSGNIKNRVPMVSVDDVIKENKAKGACLLKLDTHGFEQSILKGSKRTLKDTQLVIIESYIFNLGTSESITFDELCRVMDSYGFRMADFSEPLWRPKDMALWQFDLFFYRKDNPIFNTNSYT